MRHFCSKFDYLCQNTFQIKFSAQFNIGTHIFQYLSFSMAFINLKTINIILM